MLTNSVNSNQTYRQSYNTERSRNGGNIHETDNSKFCVVLDPDLLIYICILYRINYFHVKKHEIHSFYYTFHVIYFYTELSVI